MMSYIANDQLTSCTHVSIIYSTLQFHGTDRGRGPLVGAVLSCVELDDGCCCCSGQRLKYHTQIHVRSTRGRNRVGRKITGIEPLPGENKVSPGLHRKRRRLESLGRKSGVVWIIRECISICNFEQISCVKVY